MNWRDLRALRSQTQGLISELNRIVSRRGSVYGEIRDTTDKLVTSRARIELAQQPLDKLRDATDTTIKIEYLKRAGYNSIGDLIGKPYQALEKIPGISREVAQEIASIVGGMELAIKATTKVRLDIDNPTENEIKLIEEIKLLNDINSSASGKVTEFSELLTDIRTLEKPLAHSSTFLGWFLRPHKRRDEAITAFHELNRKLASAQETLTAAHKVTDLLNAPPAPREVAIKDFSTKSSDYYAKLEEVRDIPATFQALNNFNAELLARIESEPFDTSALKATLRKYQIFGVKFALAQKRTIIGDEMGLGKTLQALGVLAQRSQTNNIRALIVCPASVITNWNREVENRTHLTLQKIHGEGHRTALDEWITNGGIAITTFDTLKTFVLTDEEFTQCKLDTLIVDEAHYAKNLDTGRSRHINKWNKNADHVLFLTGTPLENRLHEFHGLVAMLNPTLATELDKALMAAGPDPFRIQVAPVYLRRNVEEVLDELPELIESIHEVPWTPASYELYKYFVTEGNFMGMRRAAFTPEQQGLPAKLQRIEELVEEAFDSNQKVIIFSFFLDVLKTLREHFPAISTEPITGSTPPKQRQDIIDAFTATTTPQILLGQIQSAGTGLNIQAASTVIICEPQIKPTLESQAIARAHRMGQVRTVQVHRVIIPEGIDKQMMEMLERKRITFEEYARYSHLAQSAEGAQDGDEESIAKIFIMEERKRLGIE